MSIDFLVFNFGGPPPPNEVMQVEGYQSLPLGTAAAVKQKISIYLPAVVWPEADPVEGCIVEDGKGTIFYVNPEADGLVYCIGVHPQGAADAEVVMKRFCQPYNWYVFNPQSGEFIEPASLAKYLEAIK